MPRDLVTASVKSKTPLVGLDGNAYAIIAAIDKGLKKAGAKPDERKAVIDDMQSGDYDHLLQVAIANTDA